MKMLASFVGVALAAPAVGTDLTVQRLRQPTPHRGFVVANRRCYTTRHTQQQYRGANTRPCTVKLIRDRLRSQEQQYRVLSLTHDPS